MLTILADTNLCIHVLNDIDSESDDDEEEANSVLRRAGPLLTGKSDFLPQGFLDIARVKDANTEKPSNVRTKS